MDYKEALEYIGKIERFSMKLGLERIEELLKRLGNPQRNLKIIHIAGTNGKGSVSNFISTVLVKAGYRTGLYTSPYLEKFNERIRIDGKNIEDDDLADAVTAVKIKVDEMLEDGFEHPTEFEFNTAVAFYYYEKSDVDAVVLEVGLGGRCDATNVIERPVLSVITAISKDHMGILGDTIEEIAAEKAGIIKKDSPVMVYEQSDEVMKVFYEKAGANMHVSENSTLYIEKSNLNNQVFTFKDYKGRDSSLKIRMAGRYQCKNAMLAYDCLKYLDDNGIFEIDDKSITEGFLDARWPGRFEIICEKPLFLIDGAHNIQGAESFRNEVDRLFGDEYVKTLILGILADKDVDGMIKKIVPGFDRVIVTLPDSPRAMAVEEIAYRVGMYCDDIICIEDIDSACDHAVKTFGELSEKSSKENIKDNRKGNKRKDRKSQKNEKGGKKVKEAIFAAGSLYMVGRVRTHIKNMENQ